MRGALTNGYEQLFIILAVNSDGKWGFYRISRNSYSAALEAASSDMVAPDTLLDMLATWVRFYSTRSKIAVKTLGGMIGSRWHRQMGI